MTVKIKKKSRVPGVMITQYVEELPQGMTTPDFTRKPIALTIQEGNIFMITHIFFNSESPDILTLSSVISAMFEGKLAFFRAIVTGNPTPAVTWVRNNGEIDEERYKAVYDKISGEHQLQV